MTFPLDGALWVSRLEDFCGFGESVRVVCDFCGVECVASPAGMREATASKRKLVCTACVRAELVERRDRADLQDRR